MKRKNERREDESQVYNSQSDLIDLADQLMDLADSCEGVYEFCKRSSLFRESKRSGFALGRAVVADAVVTKICRILFKNDLKEPLPVVGRQRLFNVPDAEVARHEMEER